MDMDLGVSLGLGINKENWNQIYNQWCSLMTGVRFIVKVYSCLSKLQSHACI